jgi:aquaporin Z
MYAKIAAEFFGTFWLVLGGCGSAVLSVSREHGRMDVLSLAPTTGRGGPDMRW